MSLLAEQDPQVAEAISEELDRQRNSIELIACEFHQPCRHAGHGQRAYQ